MVCCRAPLLSFVEVKPKMIKKTLGTEGCIGKGDQVWCVQQGLQAIANRLFLGSQGGLADLWLLLGEEEESLHTLASPGHWPGEAKVGAGPWLTSVSSSAQQMNRKVVVHQGVPLVLQCYHLCHLGTGFQN